MKRIFKLVQKEENYSTYLKSNRERSGINDIYNTSIKNEGIKNGYSELYRRRAIAVRT